jgi:hypothetical protein
VRITIGFVKLGLRAREAYYRAWILSGHVNNYMFHLQRDEAGAGGSSEDGGEAGPG